MTRPNKRKAGEIDYEDPMSFVTDYCRRHGVTQEPGNSDIEKSCAARAMDAREEYKEKRDAATVNSPNAGTTPGEDRCDRKGLSPAQKYTIRLQNNRKSANASKVFNEVFKRELSHCLQKLSGSVDKDCSNCIQLQSFHANKSTEYFQRIDELQKQVDELQRTTQQRDEELRKQQTVIEQLQTSLAEAEERSLRRAEMKRISDPKRDSGNTDEPSEELYVSDSGVENTMRHDDSYYNGKTSIRMPASKSHVSQLLLAGGMSGSPTPSEPDASQDTRDDKSDAAMKPIDDKDLKEGDVLSDTKATAEVEDKVLQTPYSHASASPGSFKQRLASSGILTFAPDSESQGKVFHSGLTLTQSQNDDTDDKAQLLRNLPCSGGIPVGFLGSQPSQPLLPPMKSSLGSEDLPLGGDSDLFLASQGSSGTPNKQMDAP